MEDKEIKKIKQQAIDEYKSSQTFSAIEFAKQIQSVVIEGMKDSNKKKFYKKYKPEQVAQYLSDPAKYESQLRDISRYLTVSSPQYWRLINYFSTIAKISPILIPLDIEKFKKNKNKANKTFNECKKAIENMNIQHECLKIINVACREDIFYGYEIETEDSYFIKPMNPDYCRISGVYDGCFIYEFNFAYFDSYKDELMNYYAIDKSFVKKYNLYKSKGNDFKWQELDVNREVCVKFQETFNFCCPPYVSVFNDLYDIGDYKDLNKAKVESDNNKFIGFEMPIRKDNGNTDDWLLEVDTMKTYYSLISASLSGKLGSFLSPMPFKEISFPSNKSEVDQVSNAIKSFWGSTGVADVLVGENKNAGTLKYSIMTDESILYGLYRQLERWLSRKFKNKTDGLLTAKIPNLTIFNLKDETDRYLKASEYGYIGAKTMVETCLSFSQNEIDGLAYLENDLLNKVELMIPVQSTHTQSGDVGSPVKDEVGDSGQQTRDNSSNENR